MCGVTFHKLCYRATSGNAGFGYVACSMTTFGTCVAIYVKSSQPSGIGNECAEGDCPKQMQVMHARCDLPQRSDNQSALENSVPRVEMSDSGENDGRARVTRDAVSCGLFKRPRDVLAEPGETGESDK